MLVISRKPGERVHIGEDIQVAILEITGSRVVIGIAAPREVAIRRVGPIPYGDAAAAPAGAGEGRPGVDPPQPDLHYEFQYTAPAVPQAPSKPAPLVRVKRSRLKSVPVLTDAVAANN